MPMLQKRLCAAVLAVLGAVVPAAGQGQAPSSGPAIKVIVPYPAGGLPDTVARVVGKRLQERLGHTVVIENRGGANGGIGMAALTGAPADGTTFVVSDGSMLSINPNLYTKLAYGSPCWHRRRCFSRCIRRCRSPRSRSSSTT
jgi:tripartite-type tricarboxylate transporter receptor subunit TctC